MDGVVGVQRIKDYVLHIIYNIHVHMYRIWQQQHLYTLAHPRVLNKIKIKKGRHVLHIPSKIIVKIGVL